MTDMTIQLMKSHLPNSSSMAVKRRLDIAARMGVAALYQQIMLDEKEISPLVIKQKDLATAVADMMCFYVRANPSK